VTEAEPTFLRPAPDLAVEDGLAKDGRDYVVCRVDELPPGSMRLAPIGKFGVGVYNIDGQYYAITNYCPHQGGPLCLGRVQGTSAAPAVGAGAAAYVMDGMVLRCPWHQWEFDITTGSTITRPHRRIRSYPVRTEHGCVVVTR
jgi:nitrite reductase (NADH) small subunit